MCGRYYVDDDTAREIEKVIRQVDEKFQNGSQDRIALKAGDISPAATAPVLAASGQKLCCRWQRWGFPWQKQIIFNARSESALQKKMFRESVEHRRVVVPATWFYEWSRNKEKNVFRRSGQPVLFMAGFFNRCQDEDRFVILTTAANASMEPVHDRMPLIFQREQIKDWICNDKMVRNYLKMASPMLERQQEYEQLTLF